MPGDFKDPWERLDDEGPQAFMAFNIYRELGPRRTLNEASRAYHKRPESQQGEPDARPHASGIMQDWSSSYAWRSRAMAWDEYVESQRRDVQIKAVRDMAERHANQARSLQLKAIQRLSKIDINELSAGDVLRYIMEASKLERLSLGEPTERVESTSGSGIDIGDLGLMTDEDLFLSIEKERQRAKEQGPDGGLKPGEYI